MEMNDRGGMIHYVAKKQAEVEIDGAIDVQEGEE